ncbi:MAG: hypothetical protein HYU86_10785 [Chloroflexi bacterium]|nr:hypothetical protein [Chloroflexota bacterium]
MRELGAKLLGLVTALRRNHGLEHATISLLTRGKKKSVVGRSTPWGFYVYGDFATQEVAEAAAEALRRLKEGEEDLAVSPFCGTNLAVTAILTGIVAVAVLARGRPLQRLPHVVTATLAVSLLAQPMGNLVQKHGTTSSALGSLSIRRIEQGRRAGVVYHRVETGPALS